MAYMGFNQISNDPLKPDPDDRSNVITLLYYPKINRFKDEFGNVIHDIYRLITPGRLIIFMEYKNMYLIPDITNSYLVELMYLDEELV